MAVSTDDGRTWSQAQERNPMPAAPSFDMTRLANGDILAVDYHTYMTPDSGNLQADIPEAISHDGGMTWTQFTGRETTPEPMRNVSSTTDWPGHPVAGFVLVHNVVEDPDGTLYQSGYGFYASDGTKYRQVLLTSTDEGRTWSTTTIAVNPTLSSSSAYQGFCEGAIERVADGSLLVVMRTGSYQPMYTARSTDNGATWSTPQPLLAGRDKQQVAGVYPSLTLMGNGELVLWFGRPGQSMMASPDGSGRAWTAPQEIDYANSANGATLALDSRHLLAFGDRGANWSFPTPAPYAVWVRRRSRSPIRAGGSSHEDHDRVRASCGHDHELRGHPRPARRRRRRDRRADPHPRRAHPRQQVRGGVAQAAPGRGRGRVGAGRHRREQEGRAAARGRHRRDLEGDHARPRRHAGHAEGGRGRARGPAAGANRRRTCWSATTR